MDPVAFHADLPDVKNNKEFHKYETFAYISAPEWVEKDIASRSDLRNRFVLRCQVEKVYQKTPHWNITYTLIILH